MSNLVFCNDVSVCLSKLTKVLIVFVEYFEYNFSINILKNPWKN